ncbi:16498_t:CDS:1 [Cetraspora pellucida]|uniref:16498_t:CDS:1 n=1 Tax=Cetraspora pellucida TaxID=1433469 RepID=A0ACA9K1L1_9GLOM|nr:16498_t:CDS:1 [Cetraspora pellucida]
MHIEHNENLSSQMMLNIQIILQNHNLLYLLYQQAYEILSSVQKENRLNKDLFVYLHYNGVNDKCRYNLLTANEIEVVLPGDGLSPEAIHNIIIRLQEGSLECMHKGHSAYLLLHYVLLFPHSKLGWYKELCQLSITTERQ